MSVKQQKASHEAQLEELHGQQDADVVRRMAHRPSEVHAKIPGASTDGAKEKIVEVHAFGGHVYLDSHGETRFTRDEWAVFQGHAAAAKQAVS